MTHIRCHFTRECDHVRHRAALDPGTPARIEVDGHTDNTGNAVANLSQRSADAVVAHLDGLGVTTASIVCLWRNDRVGTLVATVYVRARTRSNDWPNRTGGPVTSYRSAGRLDYQP